MEFIEDSVLGMEPKNKSIYNIRYTFDIYLNLLIFVKGNRGPVCLCGRGCNCEFKASILELLQCLPASGPLCECLF